MCHYLHIGSAEPPGHVYPKASLMKHFHLLSCRLLGMLLLMVIFGARSGHAANDDFVVQVWDADAGLLDSTVTSIAQTPDGYLWVGMRHGGLARFDGQQFMNFNPGNTPELRSIEIQKLLVDAQGTLWVGTVDGSLISYRDDHFHFECQNTHTPQTWLGEVLSSTSSSVMFSSLTGWLIERTIVNGTNRWVTKPTPNSSLLSEPCRDLQGTVWYRTWDGRLGQFRNNHFVQLPDPPGLLSPQINALLTDADGRLWVGTSNELAQWDGEKFVSQTPTNGEPELNVLQLAACPDGSLWVRTDHALRKYRDRQWIAQVTDWDGDAPQLADNNPIIMNGDSRGGVWVMHKRDGLWHVDATGHVSRMGETRGLPNELFECWFEDREGNVWIGLDGGGLVCIRNRTFHTVWPAAGQSHLAVRSICEDSSGAMWFGTSGSSLLRWSEGEFTTFTPPVNSVEGFNTIVFPDDVGQLWVGNVQNGVLTLKDGKFTRPFPASEINSVARVIYKDRADRIWFGSEFGLFCWEQGKLKHFTMADGFPPTDVLAISEDPTGSLWIGSALGELRCYKDGKFTTYRPLDSSLQLPPMTTDTNLLQNRGALTGGERFWTLYADDDGVIWIGSLGGGLLRFAHGRFTRYKPGDGLPSEYIMQILEDQFGQLWLGTQNGIARVSKAALNQFAEGGTNFVQFITYGKSDGLPTTECSSGCQPACWRSRDGHLWFAMTKGAVWVDPDKLHFNPSSPSVIIEAVLVDGQPVGEDGQPSTHFAAKPPSRLTLAPGRHYLNFIFTAPSLTAPDRVRFKWRLVGLEKEWTSASSQRSASYSFLPPGDYEFQIRACNSDGVWSDTTTAIHLTERPYYWETWWFKIVAILLGVAILGAMYSVRIARLRALERLRLRIALDLHDEVGSNLNTISLLAHLMEKNLEKSSAKEDAIQVQSIATQTFDSLRDIIWFIDPTHDKLSDLVARLETTTQQMLAMMAHTFERSGDFRDVVLPLAFRRNVLPLFKEVLHNLLRHSFATKATVTVSRIEKQFIFRIQDNGVGFDPETKSSGNGLKNMSCRAAEIGGRLEIKRSPGGGTTITLTAPLP